MCIIVLIYTFLRIGAHLLGSAPPGAAAERLLEIVQPQWKTQTINMRHNITDGHWSGTWLVVR